ncbi:permease-like cell division protein FtsX [Streptosporangium sp. NPDC020145]|uniref:permease-like cell division protein FtsX n=1 Tax=Streptosporangium sp. NPDC020145 TaxID=3154694 RepID=UPI0034438D2E
MTETENRLRDALSAAASTAVNVRPLTVPSRRRRRWVIPVAVVAAAASVAVFLTVRVAAVLSSPDRSEVVAMSVGAMDESDTSSVNVFLCLSGDATVHPGCAGGKATETEKAGIQRALQGRPEVESVSFRDQRTAYEGFQRQYEDKNPALLKTVKITDMPETFIVQVRPGADRAALLGAASELPGVAVAVDAVCLRERASLRSVIIDTVFGDEDRPSCSVKGRGR